MVLPAKDDMFVRSMTEEMRQLREENQILLNRSKVSQNLLCGADAEITLLERDNETLHQQVIGHVERISQQSQIIADMVEGARARNAKVEELTELLRQVQISDPEECRLDHDGFCQEHHFHAPCLMWRIGQILKDVDYGA